MQSTVQAVGSLIDKLAEKLSVPAAHLWSILLRQAQVVFWQDVFQSVVLLLPITAGIGTWRVTKAWEDDDPKFVFRTVGVIVAGITFIALCANVTEMISLALNPEYYAVHEVLSAIRSK